MENRFFPPGVTISDTSVFPLSEITSKVVCLELIFEIPPKSNISSTKVGPLTGKKVGKML